MAAVDAVVTVAVSSYGSYVVKKSRTRDEEALAACAAVPRV